MRRALALGEQAAAVSEVPVGAVVVIDGEIVGEGFNRQITLPDPSAHAEVVALRDAARHIGNYRMPDATLYVTVEPCTMCAGALVHARVGELVFGTREPKAGAVVSTAALLDREALNHRIAWRGGCLAEECENQMRQFFATMRANRKRVRNRAPGEGVP